MLPSLLSRLSPGLKLLVMRMGTIALLCFFSHVGPVWAVSDCGKPKTKVDWMLCSNDKAALEEERMALAFREAMNRTGKREALMQEQRDWNVNVRDVCNDVPCLVRAFRDRISELETY
jgi:uncharacterized protein